MDVRSVTEREMGFSVRIITQAACMFLNREVCDTLLLSTVVFGQQGGLVLRETTLQKEKAPR